MTRRYAASGLVLAAACALGALVPLIGADSFSQTVFFGGLVLFMIGIVIYSLLDLPVIGVVQIVFIASFFFKSEINLFKLSEVEDPSGLSLSLTFVTGLILLISDYSNRERGDRKIFPALFSLLLIALFIAAANSVLYNGVQLLGWFSLWSFSTTVFMAFVVASHFNSRERLMRLIIGIAAGLIFTGVVSLSQFTVNFPTTLAFFGTGTEDELLGTNIKQMSRAVAFMRTPTEMGWVVATLWPLVLTPLVGLVRDFDPRRKILLASAAGFGVVAIILSLARGSWISLLAAAGVVVLFGWIKLSSLEKKNYFVYVGGALILICLLLSPFAGRIYERLTMDDEGSAHVRIPLMQVAVRMIEANPLAGVGLTQYRTVMAKYDETSNYVTTEFPAPVHNVFAHITAEIGIPGGLVFGLLIVAALIECLKTMTSRDRVLFAVGLGVAAGLAAFIISGMKEPGSLGSVRPPLKTCFLMFGIIMAASRLRRRLLI